MNEEEFRSTVEGFTRYLPSGIRVYETSYDGAGDGPRRDECRGWRVALRADGPDCSVGTLVTGPVSTPPTDLLAALNAARERLVDGLVSPGERSEAGSP